MALERRRAGDDRLPLRIPVVVEQKGPSAEVPIAGETENLSRGGVLLRVARAAHPGTALLVTLRLRRSVSLTVTGTVVWTGPAPDPPPWRQGLQFDEELPKTLVAQIAEDAFPPRVTRSQ